jgi:SAM-dependent methyltransferase
VTETLVSRYRSSDLDVFTPRERARFGDVLNETTAWELLYRLEPDLYERLIAGERIHPDVIAWLPERVGRCVEIAAGTGRLTKELRPRCDELIAIEPAAPLRERLRDVDARDGFFDDLPVEDAWADLVISCSAFTRENGGEAGLKEMERVARDGALVAFVWPSDVDWLRSHGFQYLSFPGEMAIEFDSPDEALAIARIFYPDAVDAITGAEIPYEVIGVNPPRDVAYKRV